jgi:hypothetical protein
VEDGLEVGLVVVGVGSNEVDDFAIAVGCLAVVASGLVDHAEAIPAVVHVGEAFEQIVRRLLRLVELAGMDEVDGSVGCGRELVFGVVQVVCGGEPVGDFRGDVADLPPWRRCGGGERALGFLVLGEATALVFLATATGAGIIASGFGHRGLDLQKGRHSLYRALLADARFHELLLAFDRDLAAVARATGCARCGGVLHSARFRRKPRGGPVGLGEAHDQRLSFCCAVDLCRKRTTPPSFRFLGRKVYVGAVVVLVSAMRQGAAAARQLSELVGVSLRTIARWREWWRGAFAASPFWRMAAAAFMPPVDEARLPTALLERFAGDAAAQLIAVLRLLLPITGGMAMHAA